MEKRDENGLAVRLYGYEQDLYFSACPPGGTEDRLLFYVTHILKTDFLSIGCRIDIRDTFRQPCQKQRKKKRQDSHRYNSCKNCSAGALVDVYYRKGEDRQFARYFDYADFANGVEYPLHEVTKEQIRCIPKIIPSPGRA